MRRKPTDRLMAALELRQSQAVREIGAGRFIVRSQAKPNKTYSVGLRGAQFWCSCPDSELRQHICKHELASIFFPALIACLQFQWSTDLEQLEITAELHKEDLKAMPEAVKEFARTEYRKAKQRLTVEMPVAA